MSNPVCYMPDTNMFRDYVNGNAQQANFKQAAQDFWNKAKTEAAARTAEIKIPKEVEAELRIQMHTFNSKKDKNIITKILEDNKLGIVDFDLPVELERELREFTNYLRNNSNFDQTLGSRV